MGITAHSIRTDIGEIRRFKIEIVVCVHKQVEMHSEKNNRWEGRRGEEKEERFREE